MNWYKVAQSSSFDWNTIKDIVYTDEARADLANFKKSHAGKTAKEVSTLIKELIDTRRIKHRNTEPRLAINSYDPRAEKEKIDIYSFAPLGVGLESGPGTAYRIAAQRCLIEEGSSELKTKSLREQQIARTRSYVLVIKRIFERHNEDYLPWIHIGNTSHVNDCIKYKITAQKQKTQEKPVELDVNNPYSWISHSIKMIKERDIQGINKQKAMLQGKSQEEIMQILEFMTKNERSFPQHILKQIAAWVQEYFDKLG